LAADRNKSPTVKGGAFRSRIDLSGRPQVAGITLDRDDSARTATTA